MLRAQLRFKSVLTDASLRSVKSGKSKRSLPAIGEDGPSFEGFIFKAQVLQTYRDILRTVGKIPDSTIRHETKDYVKEEFRACMNVKDLETRRSLLIGGIRQFKSVSDNLGLSHTDIKF